MKLKKIIAVAVMQTVLHAQQGEIRLDPKQFIQATQTADCSLIAHLLTNAALLYKGQPEKYKAFINATQDGKTPLMQLVQNNDARNLQHFLTRANLFYKNNPEELAQLLNQKDANGKTALQCAAQSRNSAETVKILKQFGAQ